MKKVALPLRFGIATGGSLIAFFLILSLFNLHTNPIYSLFNGVITAFGIYGAIKSYKHREADLFNYIKGFEVGLITGFIATIIFTAFFLIYATEVNTEYLGRLIVSLNDSYKVEIGLVTFVVAIMGFATTIILTLSFMQLFKTSYNIK